MITLFILLNIIHWLADYTHLSTNWMLDAKKNGKPLFPIFCHALIHAILMGIVLVVYKKFGYSDSITTLYCFLLILISHFLLDTLKGKLNVWFPKLSNPSNKFFWCMMGLDQLGHQIVIIYVVKLMI